MPDYLVGQARDQMTFVKVYKNGLLYYGWKAKEIESLPGITAGEVTALGHIDAVTVAALSGAIPILGANSPKPARFKKVLNRRPTAQQQGTASTFVGIDNYADALAQGWSQSSAARGITLTDTARTKTMAAKMANGGYYLFPLNADRALDVAGPLGLILPSSLTGQERLKAFSGSSKPKPGTVKLKGDLGDKGTFVSFDADSSASTAGYQPSKAAQADPVGNATTATPDPG